MAYFSISNISKMEININPIIAYRTHKKNESISDCQDAFNICENCFAIADGATQSFYPSIWAELLVSKYCEENDLTIENWENWLIPLQKKWLEAVQERVIKAKEEERPIWFTNDRRLRKEEPAVSTFIGVHLSNIDNSKIKLEGVAIGDSCLFIYQEKITKIFPSSIISSKSFSNSFNSFNSLSKYNKHAPEKIDETIDIASNKKTYLILATDAVSKWIIENKEAETDFLKKILSIKNENNFNDFISKARSEKIAMVNDDATLVVIEISYDTAKKQISGQTSNVQKTDKTSLEKPITSTKNGAVSNSDELNKLEKIKNRYKITTIVSSFFAIIFLLLWITTLTKNNDDKKQIVENKDPINNEEIIIPDKEEIIEQVVVEKEPKITLKKHTIIYYKNDTSKAFFQQPLNNDTISVKVIEDTDTYFVFEKILYVSKGVTYTIDNSPNEIGVNGKSNLRIEPDEELTETTIFGKLNLSTQFDIISIEGDWYKLKFIGLVKK